MTEVQLLGKTEVWMHGVRLHDVDLPGFAKITAEVLGLPHDKVFVTDVRNDVVVLDVLVPRLALEQVAGRQQALLDAVARLAGVELLAGASVHSEGVLGVIGEAPDKVERILDEAQRIERGIREYASGRVAVVATGAELVAGNVRDTNFEAATEILGAAGYEVVFGGVVGDDEHRIAGLVARLAGDGFGVVITTGGVGAEDKDKTVEALERLDPQLETAVLAHYTKGQGRHVKDAVRIAVATLGWTTIVALPGPTHEVRLALPLLVAGLKSAQPRDELVEAMAVPLRASLPKHHHGHGHS
jgi:molybdenum cofactor synthesis domain-containing protein